MMAGKIEKAPTLVTLICDRCAATDFERTEEHWIHHGALIERGWRMVSVSDRETPLFDTGSFMTLSDPVRAVVRHDLCPDCMADLNTFLNGGAE